MKNITKTQILGVGVICMLLLLLKSFIYPVYNYMDFDVLDWILFVPAMASLTFFMYGFFKSIIK